MCLYFFSTPLGGAYAPTAVHGRSDALGLNLPFQDINRMLENPAIRLNLGYDYEGNIERLELGDDDLEGSRVVFVVKSSTPGEADEFVSITRSIGGDNIQASEGAHVTAMYGPVSLQTQKNVVVHDKDLAVRADPSKQDGYVVRGEDNEGVYIVETQSEIHVYSRDD